MNRMERQWVGNGGIGGRARSRECAQSGFADHFRLNGSLDASKCAGDRDFLSRTQCDDEVRW